MQKTRGLKIDSRKNVNNNNNSKKNTTKKLMHDH